ncbi:hypothetical protein JYU16_02100, partial [bacterium AH-315-M05]|nr:hypothetical protein [bacterium AH-315-M05]
TSGSGTKTLDCNIDVDGNLTITGSSTLDASVSNYNITLAGNWVDSSLFNPRNGTVFIDGSGAQSIANTTAGGETFYNLTVVKSADTLALNGNVTVSNTSGGTLTMTSANIKTGTDTLTLGTSATNVGTLIRTSGTIVGRFERWINATSPTTWLYPVGTDSYYRPAVVEFTNLTNGSLTGEFIATNPGNIGLPLNDGAFTIGNAFTEGYWNMTAGNGLASTNYDLDLVGTGFSSYTIVSQTRLLKRINSGSGWSTTNWGAHVAAVGDIAKRSGLNDISDFEFGFGDTTGCSNIPPTSIITGLDSVCTGQTGVAYSVDDHPPNTYTWIVIGGSITSGQGSNNITVDWGPTGQVGIVRVVETDECDNRAPVDLSVDIHVLPTSSITGNTLVEQYTNGEPYSVVNTPGYTYTWTVLGDSGTIATGQGSNSITVNWLGANSDTLQVVVTNGGCGTPDTVILPVTIYGIIISVQTGNWNVPATWDCNCVPTSISNVIIDSTDTVTLVGATTVNHFTIYSTGTLDNVTHAFTVSGDYTVNGTHSGTGAINLDGTNIDGIGTITNTGFLRIRVASKTIASTADLTKTTGSFVILGLLTVTNNGIMTIGGNIVEGGIGTTWVNSPGSTLNIGGTLLSGSGTLDAFGIGNTVDYNGSGAQTVKLSIAANYSHLTLSNAGTKTMPGVLDIDGNLTMSGSANFATANYDFTLAGNWTNDATFTAGTGTITFDGTTLVSGTSITSFNNATISSNLTGPANDTINVAGNWNNSGTFTHNSGTVTFNGSSAQSVTSTGGETFYNLVINNTSTTGVTLNNAVTVNDSLTLTNGIVYTTPANLLTLIDDATSTEGSINSFVSGPMRKIGDDAFVFPIGDADSTIWARLAISAPSINTTEYTARYFAVIYSDTSTDVTLNNVSGIEYWTLTQGVNDDDISVTLYWEDTARSGIDDYTSTDLVVARYNGVDWVDEGQFAITSSNPGDVTSNVVVNYSPFSFGSKGAPQNPLPIDLLYFDAILDKEEGVVDLSWATASETNNDYFTVEKSIDGVDFEFVTYLAGAGNSSHKLYYTAIDNEPYYGVSYYRLKQTDYDGKYTYSDVVAVNYIIDESGYNIAIYPNPTDGKFFVDIKGKEDSEVLVVVLDLLGKEHYSKVIILTSNGYVLAVDPSEKLSP